MTKQTINKKIKLKHQLFNLILTACFIAISLLTCYISDILPKVSGISIEFYLVIVIISFILIPNKWYKVLYLVLFSLIRMLVIPISAINFADLLLEYFLPLDIFIFYLWTNNYYQFLQKHCLHHHLLIFSISLLFFTTIIMLIRLFCFVWAGYLWYTVGNWQASWIYEIGGYWVSILVVLIILGILIIPTMKLIPILHQKYGVFNYYQKISNHQHHVKDN